jgi:hypothetical protein
MTAERRTIDRDLNTVLRALRRELSKLYPQARIDAYRPYPETIWVRIVDRSFAGSDITERDRPVWPILEAHLPERVRAQLGLLLLLSPSELQSSAMNQEFENPRPLPS